MARNPTNWSNNDIKPPSNWSGVAKGVANWLNNITKQPAAFTPITKQNSAWQSAANVSAPWPYDSATQKWDDTPLRGYDYLVPTTNTVNNLKPTGWAQVV